MRRYHQPATVDLDEQGIPARFTAWGHTFAVAEVLDPPWDTLDDWWAPENAGLDVEELRVRHFRVRAHGVQRDAVVELVMRGGVWHVVGVED
ncbi:hypothetical protein ACOZ38_25325 [Sphaerisporangium viridialbum]|uniref:hypothetical protein n=1 Tax=Sphaerisporangium viridialbum TaxID=46189 RepID=UPI003C747454